MELLITRIRIALALLVAMPVSPLQKVETDGTVEGVVVDIQEARIVNATITLSSGSGDYLTKTKLDGAYSIRLNPGVYTMSLSSFGFCTIHRSAFLVDRSASVRLNFQMWVCPTDTEFLHYAELEEVGKTHLKPLVMFGEQDVLGDQDSQSESPRRFRGPKTFEDGTRHSRNYPAIFTFNLLTVQADQLIYNPLTQLLKAIGNVTWENGSDSGSAISLEVKLDGFRPKLSPSSSPDKGAGFADFNRLPGERQLHAP